MRTMPACKCNLKRKGSFSSWEMVFKNIFDKIYHFLTPFADTLKGITATAATRAYLRGQFRNKPSHFVWQSRHNAP